MLLLPQEKALRSSSGRLDLLELFDGFEFPFGDYYELAIDDRDRTHAIFGEGISYDTPGSIWYVRGE